MPRNIKFDKILTCIGSVGEISKKLVFGNAYCSFFFSSSGEGLSPYKIFMNFF